MSSKVHVIYDIMSYVLSCCLRVEGEWVAFSKSSRILESMLTQGEPNLDLPFFPLEKLRPTAMMKAEGAIKQYYR